MLPLSRLTASFLCIAASAAIASSPSRANVNQGVLLLASGQSDCRAGRYADGVRKMTDAAVALQKTDASHSANRQWLPQVRSCLQSWVKHASGVCRREGTVEALLVFQTIETTMKYLAAPVAKQMAQAARQRCVEDIVKRQSKACLAEAGRSGVDGLVGLRERLKGLGVEQRLLDRLVAGTERCAAQWVKEADGRCQGSSTVEFLKEIR